MKEARVTYGYGSDREQRTTWDGTTIRAADGLPEDLPVGTVVFCDTDGKPVCWSTPSTGDDDLVRFSAKVDGFNLELDAALRSTAREDRRWH